MAKNKLPQPSFAKKIIAIQPEEDAGGHKVRIIGDGKLKDYNAFYLIRPPRVVIDIPDVQSSIWYKALFFESPLIKRIRLGASYKNKVRVVVDLFPAADLRYKVHSKDDHLIVDFEADHSSSVVEHVQQTKLTPPTASPGMRKKAATNPLNSKPSNPAGTILAVEVETEDKDIKVYFIGDGTVTRYKYFYLFSPPRFVIDLLDVQSSVSQKSWSLNHPLVKKIRLGTSYKDKIRVVFDLVSETKLPYKFFTKGNQFIVAFGAGSSVPPFDHTTEVQQSSDPSSIQTVEKVQSILPQIKPKKEENHVRQPPKK